MCGCSKVLFLTRELSPSPLETHLPRAAWQKQQWSAGWTMDITIMEYAAIVSAREHLIQQAIHDWAINSDLKTVFFAMMVNTWRDWRLVFFDDMKLAMMFDTIFTEIRVLYEVLLRSLHPVSGLSIFEADDLHSSGFAILTQPKENKRHHLNLINIKTQMSIKKPDFLLCKWRVPTSVSADHILTFHTFFRLTDWITTRSKVREELFSFLACGSTLS